MAASLDESPSTHPRTTEPHAETVTPEELLERVARGDREALLSLYDRFGGTLLAVALKITRSRPEAEDVVQDALTRAWRESGSFDRGRGTAVAWLIALTRNRGIDLVRARRRRRNHEDGEVKQLPPVLTPTPEALLDASERAVAVRIALLALKDDQRRVLDLAYYSGLSHSEIAERLGQPLGTVKTRIAQAVRILREALGRYAPTASGHRED